MFSSFQSQFSVSKLLPHFCREFLHQFLELLFGHCPFSSLLKKSTFPDVPVLIVWVGDPFAVFFALPAANEPELEVFSAGISNQRATAGEASEQTSPKRLILIVFVHVAPLGCAVDEIGGAIG